MSSDSQASEPLNSTEYNGMSLQKKLTIGVLGALPAFFVLGMIMMYVTVVFRGFGAYTGDLWKVFVTLLAFGIKVAGNKGLLKIVGGGRPWMTDFNLFFYEFATATLLRILQLSIPNEHIAQLMSLFSGVCAHLLLQPNSKYRANRMGDLFKSLSMKPAVTVSLTGFVLATTLT